MINNIQDFNKKQKKERKTKINTGDLIEIFYIIKENDKKKIQSFKGICIAIKKNIHDNITLRKISFNIGTEKTFPLNSEIIQQIKIIKKNKIKKSKLYNIKKTKK
mgnify:FL=1